MDLDQIYKSAQPLRWIKLNDGKYVVQDGNSAVKVMQQKSRLIVSCTEDEFYDKWYRYFDLGTDYGNAYFGLRRQDEFLKICAVRNGGVRVIHQDLFECIITHIIYSNCDYSFAERALNKLVATCGVEHIQGMREVKRITWHEFPTPEAIIENINNLVLPEKACNEIREICESIIEGWLDIDELKGMEFDKARSYLAEFCTNYKVLDFISLYGLHSLSWFPQNKFVDDIITREYWDIDLFVEEHLGNLQGHEGIVYMYIVSNELNPPRNMADEMKVGAHRWG
ncbi:MAG: hypothetical protein IKK92_09700 [Prevotella sp.]|nr:hypothetical protein [Prevotella sp.]